MIIINTIKICRFDPAQVQYNTADHTTKRNNTTESTALTITVDDINHTIIHKRPLIILKRETDYVGQYLLAPNDIYRRRSIHQTRSYSNIEKCSLHKWLQSNELYKTICFIIYFSFFLHRQKNYVHNQFTKTKCSIIYLSSKVDLRCR